MTQASSIEAGAHAPVSATKPGKPAVNARSGTLFVSLALLVLVLLAWQFLPPALDVPKFIIPTVTDCLAELKRMWMQEGLVGHTLSTALYTVLGFAIGSLLGAVIGYLLGMSEFWEKVLSPTFWRFRSHRRSPSRRCSSCGSATTPCRSCWSRC